jgi:hypothetical protein
MEGLSQCAADLLIAKVAGRNEDAVPPCNVLLLVRWMVNRNVSISVRRRKWYADDRQQVADADEVNGGFGQCACQPPFRTSTTVITVRDGMALHIAITKMY